MAVVVLVAATVYYLLFPDIPNSKTQHTYSWVEGSKAYDYSVRANTTIDLNGMHIDNDIEIDSIINLKIFSIEDDIVKAGFFVKKISVKNDGKPDYKLRDMYSLPLLVEMTKAGKFLKFTYPKNATDTQRKALLSFYSYLEAVVSSDDEYTVTQEDGLGERISTYKRLGATYTRINSDYSKTVSEANTFFTAHPVINHSDFTFSTDEKGVWLKALAGEERIAYLTDNGEQPVSSSVEVTLEIAGDGVVRGVFDDMSFEKAETKLKKGLVAKDRDESLSPGEAKRVAGVDSSGLRTFMNSLSGKKQSEELFALRDFLGTNEAYLEILPDIIRSGALTDMQGQVAIAAAGLVGSDMAQRALLEIMGDVEFDIKNRMRAVVAVGSISRPLASELDTYLFENLENLQQNNEILDVSSSSVLAIGIVAGNIKQDYPLESTELLERLVSALDLSDDYQRKYILKSLGNTHDEEYADVIVEYLGSGNPELRLAAVESLRYMNTEEVDSKLVEVYTSENDKDVQLAIVNALRNKPELDAEILTKVAEGAELIEDGLVRSEMIRLILDNIISQPKLKSNLEGMLKTEDSKENAKQILKAIGKLRLHNKYK